jgi:hypothetical protein
VRYRGCYDIDAINSSRRNVDSSIGVETIRLNPQSVVGWFGGPAAGGRGFGQGLEGSGRFAGAEVAMRGPSNGRWGTGMVQPVSEGQEMEEGRADLELGQQERRCGFFIDLGVDIGAGSRFKNIHQSAPVGTSATISAICIPPCGPHLMTLLNQCLLTASRRLNRLLALQGRVCWN